jgi:hypothetical protein
MGRALDVDGPETPELDPRAIVLGGCTESQLTPPPARSVAVVWAGSVLGDGTGPQRSYYQLYDDGTGHCQCPSFFFRAVLKRDRMFVCKHVRRARTAAPKQP